MKLIIKISTSVIVLFIFVFALSPKSTCEPIVIEISKDKPELHQGIHYSYISNGKTGSSIYITYPPSLKKVNDIKKTSDCPYISTYTKHGILYNAYIVFDKSKDAFIVTVQTDKQNNSTLNKFKDLIIQLKS